jgi:hypothetical protein
MRIHDLNVWAILAATVSAFVLGGLWYSQMLFGKAWRKANGFGDGEPQPAGGLVFGISFILCLVMAINLAMFLHDPKTDLIWGATAGLLAGFGWAAMGLGVVSLFERRPLSYMLINGGYLTFALTLMGAILGGWR